MFDVRSIDLPDVGRFLAIFFNRNTRKICCFANCHKWQLVGRFQKTSFAVESNAKFHNRSRIARERICDEFNGNVI